jgi:hypothetical protein
MPISEEDKETLATADIFRPLLKLPGWRAFLALLDHHIAQKQLLISHPVMHSAALGESAMDKLIDMESHKGAIVGLRLARTAVDNMIAHADELRKRIKPEEED